MDDTEVVFALLKDFKLNLEMQHHPMLEEQIRKAVDQMQVSRIRQKDQ